MPTTITVDSLTHEKLKRLKEKENFRTFDELLGEIADRELGVPESMFGEVHGLKENFEREHGDRI